MPITETEYNNLYKYSLNIAQQYIGYKDSAFDIAQNSMLSLISSKKEIKSPYSWLRTTVKREAQKYISVEKRHVDTISEKTLNTVDYRKTFDEESDEILKVSSQKIKQILSKQDFEFFLKLKKHKFSIKQLATEENISPGTVKTTKRRIKRNIMSAYLVEDGWSVGSRILNYNQYLVITRFIHQIIESVKNKQLDSIRNYLQKVDNQVLSELFEGVDSCLEWHITYSEDNYHLFLICSPLNPLPKVIELSIKFSKVNFLFIVDAKDKNPKLIVEKPADEILRYKEKGKINLSEEQIVSILTDKQTDI